MYSIANCGKGKHISNILKRSHRVPRISCNIETSFSNPGKNISKIATNFSEN